MARVENITLLQHAFVRGGTGVPGEADVSGFAGFLGFLHHIENAVINAFVHVFWIPYGMHLPKIESVGIETFERCFKVLPCAFRVARRRFRHQENIIAILRHEQFSEAAFTAHAIFGVRFRAIKEPHAAFQSCLDGFLCLCFLHIHNMPAADTEHRHCFACASEPPGRQKRSQPVAGFVFFARTYRCRGQEDARSQAGHRFQKFTSINHGFTPH